MKSAKRKPKRAFIRHTQTLRQAREQVDQAVSTLDQACGQANRAIKIIFELFFDHVCRKRRGKKISLCEINISSSVIQRLVQSMEKLGSVKKTVRMEAQEHALTLLKKSGLPPEIRDELEKELQLVG